MLQYTGPCLQAEFHGGLGNWLYISVEVGLVAYATNHSLVLPNFMHEAFRLPDEIDRPGPKSHCRIMRNMQCASGDHDVRETVAKRSGTSFEHTRATMFRLLFGAPRIDVPFVGTAIHLRSVSDVHCHTYTTIRKCRHECVLPGVLTCIAKTPALPLPIVILSDSLSLSRRTMTRLQSMGYDDVRDESAVINASDHSGLSSHAAWNAMKLWNLFARARVRFASGGSTFSKSALLALVREREFVVDTRCHKAHASDGALFTCRHPDLTDLV